MLGSCPSLSIQWGQSTTFQVQPQAIFRGRHPRSLCLAHACPRVPLPGPSSQFPWNSGVCPTDLPTPTIISFPPLRRQGLKQSGHSRHPGPHHQWFRELAPACTQQHTAAHTAHTAHTAPAAPVHGRTTILQAPGGRWYVPDTGAAVVPSPQPPAQRSPSGTSDCTASSAASSPGGTEERPAATTLSLSHLPSSTATTLENQDQTDGQQNRSTPLWAPPGPGALPAATPGPLGLLRGLLVSQHGHWWSHRTAFGSKTRRH